MADVLQDWLADHKFGCTISSVDGVTAVLQGGSDTASMTAETIGVEATMHLGSPCAQNILALDSFSVMIQEVLARILSVNISMIKVGSSGAATAVHFSLSVTGGDLSIIKRPSCAGPMTTSFQREFISRNLSCTISLTDGLNASVSQSRPDASALMTETVKVGATQQHAMRSARVANLHSSRLLL